MANKTYKDKIGKLLSYALGFKPDEFFLIPDEDGYVKIKDLVKAFGEQKELRWINKQEINSYLLKSDNPVVEVKDNLIRSVLRENMTQLSCSKKIPGELYTCIRKKAWPHVYSKGLYPEHSKIILTAKKELSLSLGKRIDNEPVLLYVSTKIAHQENISFYSFGEEIYIAHFLKKNVIKGPAIEKIIEQKETAKLKKVNKPQTPGTFIPKPDDIFVGQIKKETPKGSWKKNKKKLRKSKVNYWPDQ